jgi:hypothetical protein
MALSREAILTASDVRTKVLDVPEWGGEVIIRSLTAGWRDQFEADLLAARQAGNLLPADISARMLVASLIDEAGQPLFTMDDVSALSAKSSGAVSRVSDEIRAFNALGAGATEAIKGN